MNNIKLYINDNIVEVPPEYTVLQAINSSNEYVPQLCKDKDMKAIGACRTCLVKIDNVNGFPSSCSTPVSNNMKVYTNTPDLINIRKGVIELTLSMVKSQTKNKSNKELLDAAKYHGISKPKWNNRKRDPIDDSNPVFNISMDSCILCARCVQACQDGHQFIGAIDFLGNSTKSKIGTFMDKPLIESTCTTCGQCLSVCPTGAIQTKLPVINPIKEITTTCPYCGVGCGIKAKVNSNEEIIEMLDDPENKSSVGMLCVKGRFGYKYVHHKDRLTDPLIRKNGDLVPVKWEEVIEYTTKKLMQYRGDSFATLCSAKATNEDGYIQQKFSRLIMQSNHIDHCTRLCHSPSVEAMLESLGSGATSNSYIDYEEAGCLVIVGSDANSNHPVAAARMRKAVVENGAKLIIINPRRIEMCDYADIWLRPFPGTDVTLFNAIAKVILDQNLLDKEFIDQRTEGFKEWSKIIEKYTLEYAEKITGVSSSDILEAAKLYASPKFSGSCLIWGMGITQHTNGTANAHSLLNLALLTGQLGKPGSGISPLRGQNNVQGCGDAGCLPNSFPGYQVINPTNIKKFETAWGGFTLPNEHGLVVTDMVEQINTGRIKAMYITGENPLLSEPDLHHAEESFKKLELLIVQDIFLHETAEIADIVLPATTFAEKDGTFTNSERRVQRVRKLVNPLHNSLPDWKIISELAINLSKKINPNLIKEFKYTHPSEIWEEMANLTPSMSGISYERLEKEGGIQWPCINKNDPGTRYLYANDFPRGNKAKFVGFHQDAPAKELPSKNFPLILNTGRILYHWHGGTITRRSKELLDRAPELEISINESDGKFYGVLDKEWIKIKSRRGILEGRAIFSDKMRKGEIFIPFVKLNKHAANFLTNAVFDEYSKIPEYKVCAVKIEKILN